ncbi:agamous-like MADS-box protein AGL65 [Carex rostrata]
MDGNKKKMDENKESSHQRRISGMAKKMEELSILSDTESFFLSFNPNGKAELVLGPNTNFEDMVNRFVNLSPKERYESEQEGIKALKEAFKENSKHQIDVQPRMNLEGSGTSHAIEQGPQRFLNLTEEIYPKDKKFGELG